MNDVVLGYALGCLAATILAPVNAFRITVLVPVFLAGLALGSFASDRLIGDAANAPLSLVLHVVALILVMGIIHLVLGRMFGAWGTALGAIVAFWIAADISHLLARDEVMGLDAALSPNVLIPTVVIYGVARVLDSRFATRDADTF